MSAPIESRHQPRVLVADDDPSTRLIMREVLQQAGFEVIEAIDGREALQCYENSTPDVILLDVEMPHLDGFSVCRKIREKETSRQTPICMVTGLDDDQSIDRAYHAGATDFISKPIAWPVLVHRVRYMIRATEALNEIKGMILALPDSVFVLDENGVTCDCEKNAGAVVCSEIAAANGMSFEEIIPLMAPAVLMCLTRLLVSMPSRPTTLFFLR